MKKTFHTVNGRIRGETASGVRTDYVSDVCTPQDLEFDAGYDCEQSALLCKGNPQRTPCPFTLDKAPPMGAGI
jgi:hypothetical protein